MKERPAAQEIAQEIAGGDENKPSTRPRPVILRDAKGRFLPGTKAQLGHGPVPGLKKPDMLKMLYQTADSGQLEAGFRAIWRKFAHGERWAVELVLAYTIGRPVQRSISARGELVDLLKSWRADALALDATEVAAPQPPVDITPDYVEHEERDST